MIVQIVSSCWRYWRCLNYHLSAVALDPPRSSTVVVSVAYSVEDEPTIRVLDHFSGMSIDRVVWDFRPMDRTHLMRRAIARNLFAKSAIGDWLVFTDVDYIYSGTVVDSLALDLSRLDCGSGKVLAYTPNLCQSVDHAAGDAVLSRVAKPGPLVLGGHFDRNAITRPIGGSQIVSKATATEFGYVPDLVKFQTPCDTWQRTFEDVAYRQDLLRGGAMVTPLRTTGVTRIRHSKCGRETVGCEN